MIEVEIAKECDTVAVDNLTELRLRYISVAYIILLEVYF